MLLTISTKSQPATDLGYLLHKNPANLRSVSLSFGRAHVFYPEASDEVCTAALLLEVDPVGLVRGGNFGGKSDSVLSQYVNDRPYVASSFMSTALSRVFGTAMSGKSKERQERADTPLPFEVTISALPCKGGPELLRKLFEPLGYSLEISGYALDETFPEWGESRIYTVTLSGTQRIRDLLNHLYVLIPVFDDMKHYWVGREEIDKVLAKGEGWLKDHPERDQILLRSLKRRSGLVRRALAQLTSEEEEEDSPSERAEAEEAKIEMPLLLNQVRMNRFEEVLIAHRVSSVLDLGCGEGKLLKQLVKRKEIARLVGVDASHRALERASSRLKLDDLPSFQRERVDLLHGSLIYRDERFNGFDAATLVEVIEHLELERLPALERVVFEFSQPPLVLVSTPNVEFNVTFESMEPGAMRNSDHRFEWTRQEFQDWATRVAEEHDYDVDFEPIGEEHPDFGAPTQLAIFTYKGEQ